MQSVGVVQMIEYSRIFQAKSALSTKSKNQFNLRSMFDILKINS